MNYKYTFSVITVCYNVSDCIEKTIHSIMKQDCSDFEYIIIDGLSTDNTIEKVKREEHNFNGRMKIVSEKDNGLYDAMNKGIAIAEGEYLIFINADDELCLDILSKIKHVISDMKERPDVIYGDSINIYYDRNEQVTKVRHSYPQINCKTLKKGMGVVHQSIFTRKTLFDRIDGFNIEYSIGADWDFLIRAVKSKATMLYIPIPICKFPTDGISSTNHALQRHKIRKLNKLYWFIDFQMIKDVIEPAYLLQLFIGNDRYNKVRYYINKYRFKNND